MSEFSKISAKFFGLSLSSAVVLLSVSAAVAVGPHNTLEDCLDLVLAECLGGDINDVGDCLDFGNEDCKGSYDRVDAGQINSLIAAQKSRAKELVAKRK